MSRHPDGTGQAIPPRVRRILLGGFLTSSADKVIENWRRRGRPNHVNPGALTGEVIAYLWEDDPDEAMTFLAGYLAELNLHHPDAGTFGTVSLQQLLDGLDLCMPAGFGGLDALRAKAREDVPAHYGSPI